MLPRLALSSAMALVLGLVVVEALRSGSVLRGVAAGLLVGSGAVLVRGGITAVGIAVGRQVRRVLRRA